MSELVNTTPENWLPHFRLSAFRAGQKEVVTSVLAGRDCLCIMPTGGGKSLCYQLPAVMRPGVVLVISPLIALMKDQVDALQSLGLRATFINSSLDSYEQGQRLDGMSAGEFDLVYIAPERLRSGRFLESAKSVTVQLLAVDEAHCISEWGHDFRPDYSRIGKFREKLGFPQTIALTATATPMVREDVAKQLQLRTPDVFVTGFARPNLRFEVHEPASGRDKDELLLQLLDETPGAAIIYASTRKRCESIVEFLSERRNHRVGLYHAGLEPDARRTIQEEFMSGQVPLIVATNAFGMGIDKRELRLVVHYNMPGSLEAYYQESGRAGRDGLPSRCALLFSYSDRFIQEFFIENKYPSRDTVRKVYEFLRIQPGDPIELTQHEIKDALQLSLSGEGIGVCERLLEKCGILERMDAKQNMAQVKLDSDLPTLVDLLPQDARIQRRVLRELEKVVDDRRREWVSFHPAKIASTLDMDREALYRSMRELSKLSVFDYVPPFRGRAIHFLQRDVPFSQLKIDFDELKRRQAAEMQKLERVITYAQTRGCRQREILTYFGDSRLSRCEVCDNCQPVRTAATQRSTLSQTEVAIPGTDDAVQENEAAGQAKKRPDESVVEAVRIVLSGAARTRGKIGRRLLAKMLCGSQSVQISQLQLDRLSTFGLLSDLSQIDVGELILSIIQAKLLYQSEPQRHRPVVQLTDLGGEVMRGQHPLPDSFTLPQILLLRLRRRAKQPARRAAPAVTPGNSRWSDRPEPVSAVDASDPIDSVEPVFSAPPPTVDPFECDVHRPPDYYWTWRLLDDGYSLPDCMAARNIQREVLEDHLRRAAQAGLHVKPEWTGTAGSREEEDPLAGRFVG